ncbi:hypothetical protein [Mycobacterium sp.]|uniref:hypothetical protein n=1 Tax=Mycobacterium sp. TaxID=1785 RepID=UPI003A857DD7
MILTGAFLAEQATVVENTLSVSGGVLSRFGLGPDRAARFVLVVLTQEDPGSTDRQIKVEMRPPNDDEPFDTEFEVPETAVTDLPGFAFFELQVKLPADGRWLLVVTSDSGSISLPVLVSEMPQQGPPPTPSFGI